MKLRSWPLLKADGLQWLSRRVFIERPLLDMEVDSHLGNTREVLRLRLERKNPDCEFVMTDRGKRLFINELVGEHRREDLLYQPTLNEQVARFDNVQGKRAVLLMMRQEDEIYVSTSVGGAHARIRRDCVVLAQHYNFEDEVAAEYPKGYLYLQIGFDNVGLEYIQQTSGRSRLRPLMG